MQHLPRVAAVHDMSGYGKCALTVVIPIVSACGVEVCPVPTANFSANTSFPGFRMTDFTPYIDEYIKHWKELDVKLDGIYSGFLGSKYQIDTIIKMKRDFAVKCVIIDPVMGDNGTIYTTFDDEMCKKMRELASISDILTPNLTEAAILAGLEYRSLDTERDTLYNLCVQMQKLGAKNIVLTGVPRGDSVIISVMDTNGSYREIERPRLPINMHGTGDTFSSVLCGKYMSGTPLYEAAEMAADFVSRSMQFSYDVDDFKTRGVCFEPLLHTLA